MLGTGREHAAMGSEREELGFLRSVVENANDAILVTEGTPVNEPAPRIVYVNEAFARSTGYTWEDVRGETPRILQGPDTNPEPRQKIREALERWGPVRVELVNYRKDGTEFWVELNIVPVLNDDGIYTHWVSVQRDVTERKREEEEKRKSEESLRSALAERASDLVATLEPDGALRYVSPSVKKLLGFSPEEEGAGLFALLHPDDAERVREAF